MLNILKLLKLRHLARMKSSVTNQSGRNKTRVKQQFVQKRSNVCQFLESSLDNNKDSSSSTVLHEEFQDLYHKLQVNSSQILGFNEKELSKRVNMFCRCGIHIKDSFAISLSIPSCLNVNNDNFKSIIKILKQFKLPIERLLFSYPSLGAIDSNVLNNNLSLLSKIGFRHGIGDILIENPLLLSYPLTKSTLQTLKKINFNIGESSTTIENLKVSLTDTMVQNNVADKLSGRLKPLTALFNNAVAFLNNYDVNILQIFKTTPELFFTEAEVLEKCHSVVLSEPFCITAEEVEWLLNNYPDVFLTFSSEESQRLIKYISSVTVTTDRLYKLLLKQPEIFRDVETFFNRVELFKKYGVVKNNIGRLLAQKGGAACFTACQDFTDESLDNILQLYFSKKDITPLQLVVSSPIALSLKSKDVITSRLPYYRSLGKMKNLAVNRKKSKSQLSVQTIIRINRTDFIEKLCSSTVDNYEDFCSKNSLKPL